MSVGSRFKSPSTSVGSRLLSPPRAQHPGRNWGITSAPQTQPCPSSPHPRDPTPVPRHQSPLPAPHTSPHRRWFAGEVADTRERARGRSYRIFRHNVFHHIGHISTLSQPKGRFNPECYTLLYDWLLPKEVSPQ